MTKHVYEDTPPSDVLVTGIRAQMQFDASNYVRGGLEKVKRVRIEVEFGSGETLSYEVNVSPK